MIFLKNGEIRRYAIIKKMGIKNKYLFLLQKKKRNTKEIKHATNAPFESFAKNINIKTNNTNFKKKAKNFRLKLKYEKITTNGKIVIR